MTSIFETIARRRSVRTYRLEAVDDQLKHQVMDFAVKNQTGPFGNVVRFSLVEFAPDDLKNIKSLGTYGFIRGASLYLSGTIKPGRYAMEDFGYCMEKVILRATELGLGTCWLGGTLNRGDFAKRIGIREGEVVPAATPIGYAKDVPRRFENVVRAMSRADSRKPFGSLFFSGDELAPLEEKTDDPFIKILQAVRAAPSASNKQPWRIVRKHNEFHFYLDEDKLYNSAFKNIPIQNLDLGIAMAHFELTAEELGLRGEWSAKVEVLKDRNWLPIIAWKVL